MFPYKKISLEKKCEKPLRGYIMRENWELIELDSDEWDTLSQEEYDYLVRLLDNLCYEPDLDFAFWALDRSIQLEKWYANSTLCRNG